MRRLVGEFVGSASGIANGIRIVVLRARARKRTRIGVRFLGAGFIGVALVVELQTSWLQSKVLSTSATAIAFTVQPGPNPGIRWPRSGPYDRRLGYTDLSTLVNRLNRSGFDVHAQARSSWFSTAVGAAAASPIYREKTSAGLNVLDRNGAPLLVRLYPERIYPDFKAIPSVVVGTLLFIENRELLDPSTPRRNPAVEWDRLSGAVGNFMIQWLRPGESLAGGSTLATQLEKLRHSPGGRTESIAEKARQMTSASLRAYIDGEETLPARKRIVRDYLNSLPLASRSGYGEIYGLGDGLWAWFGADFDRANRILREIENKPPEAPSIVEQAQVYRQVLSLLLATKKPSVYLNDHRQELSQRTDSYLRLLSAEGLIPDHLRDAALDVATPDNSPKSLRVDFAERKGVDSIRADLMRQLGLAQLYDLDRLDLTVRTTLDKEASIRAAKVLSSISEPIYASAAGLTGERLLNADDVKPVIYSFSLYERTAAGNALRVQVDNVDRPLNINEGTKLELGSTAKLRTLVTYLEVIAELHTRYNSQKGRPPAPDLSDPISRWAAEYWARATDNSLPVMLEAAMNRTYSAHPGERFFTGGGLHQFQNFDAEDNGRILTVRDAFRRSVNLPFIRLMRDLVDYHMYRVPGTSANMLMNPNDPARARYLSRFADEEGRKFLGRFYAKYAGKDSDSAIALLMQGRSQSLRRLAVTHRSVRPGASFDEFAGFLAATPPGRYTNVEGLREMYRGYSRERFGLNDRAYLANVHPLELWLIEFLTRRPTATFEEVVNASVAERQEVYGWLLDGKRKRAQDLRIRTLLEADAFGEIHRRWQRLGYPFSSLTPSLATAIGSSADTPAALSELAGIILNGGVRYPPDRIQSIHFAQGTPYETVLGRRAVGKETVLSQAVTEQVKQELIGVVEKGTGRRALGSVVRSDGTILAVGGKTGTGDNRVHFYASKGALIGSSPMNRTAAFVFIIGDRFFGTVVAFVPGNQAAGYHFTSALPLQVFRQLVPAIRPLLES